MSTRKAKKKYLAVITYCIALVCLILGLFLPIYDGNDMLFMSLPDAFCKLFGINHSFGHELTREYIVNFGSSGIDFLALTVLLYAVVTVAGIVLLVPVLASNSRKKTASICAYTGETAAAIVLYVYTLLHILNFADAMEAGQSFTWDYGVIGIAFGGTLLMLIIQSIGYKGRSGIIKLVCALLGAVAVMFMLDWPTLFNYTKYEIFGGNFFIGYYNDIDGITMLNGFFSEGFKLFGSASARMAACGMTGIGALLVLVNFAIDLIMLCTDTKKSSLIVDVIRYALEVVLLLVAMIIILALNASNLSPGLMMVAIFAVAVVQLTISSIRCGLFRSSRRRQSEPEAENAEIPAPQPSYAPTAYVHPVYMQPVYAAPQTGGQTGGEIVYAPREIYRGPSDSFIETLEESEKIEFGKMFLDKQKGPCPELPDYVVGGDNEEFFNCIFLYLGKYRTLISDGLMNKIYQQIK